MDDETFPTESTDLPPSDAEVRARPAARVRDGSFATLRGELLVRADEDAWDLFPSEGPLPADDPEAASELVATPLLEAVSWEPPLEDGTYAAEASAGEAPVTAVEGLAYTAPASARRLSPAVLIGATGWALFVGLFLLTRDPGPLPPAARDEAPAPPAQVATVAARAASESRDPGFGVRGSGTGCSHAAQGRFAT